MIWICARAKIGSELSVCEDLQAETFCPAYTLTVRHARKEKEVQKAALEGYLFAKTDHIHDILSTHNVYSIISGPDGPKSVPESVIEDLRHREAQGEFDALQRHSRAERKRFQERAEVLLMSGLFKDFVLLVKRDLGHVIRGTINGQSVEVPETSLRG